MGSMDLPGNKPKPRTATPLVWKLLYIILLSGSAYYFHTSTREAAAVRYQLTLSTAEAKGLREDVRDLKASQRELSTTIASEVREAVRAEVKGLHGELKEHTTEEVAGVGGQRDALKAAVEAVRAAQAGAADALSAKLAASLSAQQLRDSSSATLTSELHEMEMNIARLANETHSLNAATRRDPADWQPLDIASISEPPKADAIHALDGVPESADASPPPPPPVPIDTDAAPVDADAVERTGEAADGSEADAPVDAAAEQAIEKIDSGSEL